jgi:hypothetical protein
LKFKSKVLIASASSLVIGLAVFFSIQAVGEAQKSEEQAVAEAQKSEEQAVQNEANSLACETYMTFDHTNWKDDMVLGDYIGNSISLEALARLGGSPEYMSLLNNINRDYKDYLEGKGAHFIWSMGALSDWCEPYLK